MMKINKVEQLTGLTNPTCWEMRNNEDFMKLMFGTHLVELNGDKIPAWEYHQMQIHIASQVKTYILLNKLDT